MPAALRRAGAEPSSDAVPDRAASGVFELALVHVHLPKVERAGLVEWDGAHASLTLDARRTTVPSPIPDRFHFSVSNRRSHP